MKIISRLCDPAKQTAATENFQTILTSFLFSCEISRKMFIDYELKKYHDLQQELDGKPTSFPGFLGFLNNLKNQETQGTSLIVNSY